MFEPKTFSEILLSAEEMTPKTITVRKFITVISRDACFYGNISTFDAKRNRFLKAVVRFDCEDPIKVQIQNGLFMPIFERYIYDEAVQKSSGGLFIFDGWDGLNEAFAHYISFLDKIQ